MLVLLAIASFALVGCSLVASTVIKNVPVAKKDLSNQAVEQNLGQAMQALEEYSTEHGGSIRGASLEHLSSYGFVALAIDKNLRLKTSTEVDFCVQVTSPTGRTYKDHFNGAVDGGVAEGQCIEGPDYD